jgi:hypothetical protein
MAQPDTTERLLNEAYRVLTADPTLEFAPAIPDRALLITTITYTRSLLSYWRGDLDAAWDPAIQAATFYTITGHLGTAARAELHAADSLIDLALRLPEDGDRLTFAGMAQRHLGNAVRLARKIDDDGALTLALLTSARVTRLLGPAQDSRALIEEVICRAKTPPDIMLLAQAYTVLGEEWEFQGNIALALTCYRDVLAVLEGSDLPGLGIWARRALNRHGEFHPL